MTTKRQNLRLDLSQDSCLIIGEVAQAHEGSLGLAHAFIDAIADAGADAVKFQTHIASAETTPAEPWRVKLRTQDASRYDYWKRMEFEKEGWKELRDHAADRDLYFLSSPFSSEAIDLLMDVGVAGWKIASGEVTNEILFEQLSTSGLPVLLSSGMSKLAELDEAVRRTQTAGLDLAVMQCTSMYPTPAEKVGLNLLAEFQDRYDCPVGLSDHSGTIFPALAAVTLGAKVIEVHVTLSREMFGPDVTSSVTTSELRDLTRGARFIESMRRHPVSKDEIAEEFESMRSLFQKSLVFACDLPEGTHLDSAHVRAKKPGTGIPVAERPRLLGRRLARSVERDEQISEDDFT